MIMNDIKYPDRVKLTVTDATRTRSAAAYAGRSRTPACDPTKSLGS